MQLMSKLVFMTLIAGYCFTANARTIEDIFPGESSDYGFKLTWNEWLGAASALIGVIGGLYAFWRWLYRNGGDKK